ncbi:hypothetical protein Mgra_00009611 [Meloidogyne graminicola]|uniref:Uncharacterized protein n=1 Tax=Meloidogyne graminicola TaxID=189291 RepID=A0A8S9ZDA0_9BILA|nr:hypothetical protein Mgra_00009611 [Meloidogyne graminicola]
MISQLIRDNSEFIKQLAKTRSLRKRKRILKRTTSNELLSIAEICLNIAKGRFKLTKRQKYRLLPFVDFVRRTSRVLPEEIYNGLLRQPTTDDINLEYTRKQLDKIKGQNGNPEIKNNNYNQELRRYLHILNEKKNLPADVSVRHLETPALEQLKKLFPNTDNPSINIEKTKESELMAAIKSPLTDDQEESMYTAESSPELMEDTPRSSKTPTAKGSQKLIKIENIIKFHQDKFKVNEYGKNHAREKSQKKY